METILKYLREDARFRERKNKNKGIANLIIEKYGIEIPKEKRADIVTDILSMDRYWRDILKHDKTLRGTDYDDKKKLEQEAQANLGYEAGYYQDKKILLEVGED